MKVRKKHFIFGSEKCEEKIAIVPKYHISRFPNLLNFCEEDLQQSELLLRKGVMYYEYIGSCEKVTGKITTTKDTFI